LLSKPRLVAAVFTVATIAAAPAAAPAIAQRPSEPLRAAVATAAVALAALPAAGPAGAAPAPTCSPAPCSPQRLRRQIRVLHAKAAVVRDERGLLHLRLPALHLDRGIPSLLTQRARWRRLVLTLKRAKPLWRRLGRWDQWMCIHKYEGAWNSIDGPYYGGLQMNIGFQQTYGADMLRRYGTADRWPIAAQVAVAERAFPTRGFTPWPNTARMCGLL
jgi:hypothetical protein